MEPNGCKYPLKPETIALKAALKEQRQCRAKTRAGHPCKVWQTTRYCPTSGKYRCKFHGGATPLKWKKGKRHVTHSQSWSSTGAGLTVV